MPEVDALNGLYQRKDSIETAPLQDDAILFHAEINRFCILNRTGSFIWSRLQTPVSPQQIAEEIAHEFRGVTVADALGDVRQALARFLELELVVSR